MRYRYQLVLRVDGISLQEKEVEIVTHPEASFRAFLTTDPDDHCEEADHSNAIGRMALVGIIGQSKSGTLDERLAAHLEEIRRERREKYKDGPYLIIEHTGEIEDLDPGTERELDSFVFRIDGAPKDELRARVRSNIAAVLTALALECQRPLHTERVSDAVVFYRRNGKPVYAVTFKMHAAASVSSPLPTDAIGRLEELYRALAVDPSLEKVVQLFVASLEREQEALRGFLSAWSGLEILVNKLFGYYEEILFSELASGEHPEIRSAHLARIREVMKDKYRLVDRFAVIAMQLCPTDADGDVETFKELKKKRDLLLHGQEVDGRLPIGTTQELLKKYLALHVCAKGSGF